MADEGGTGSQRVACPVDDGRRVPARRHVLLALYATRSGCRIRLGLWLGVYRSRQQAVQPSGLAKQRECLVVRRQALVRCHIHLERSLHLQLSPTAVDSATHLVQLWVDVVHVVDDAALEVVRLAPYSGVHDPGIVFEFGHGDDFALARLGERELEAELMAGLPRTGGMEWRQAVRAVDDCSVCLIAQRARLQSSAFASN